MAKYILFLLNKVKNRSVIMTLLSYITLKIIGFLINA